MSRPHHHAAQRDVYNVVKQSCLDKVGSARAVVVTNLVTDPVHVHLMQNASLVILRIVAMPLGYLSDYNRAPRITASMQHAQTLS